MSMRRFHKYFNTYENFENKKKAIDSNNNEYIDADGDVIFAPDEIDIKWDDICFIAGNSSYLPRIYTHGEYYTGNTIPLETAYETYTHGFADALDVANIIVENEEVVSFALAYHHELITDLQSDKLDTYTGVSNVIYGTYNGAQQLYTAGNNIQFNNDGTISANSSLNGSAYINVTNNVISASYTTLKTAYETGVDGLATAYDVANTIVKNEEVISYELTYLQEQIDEQRNIIQQLQAQINILNDWKTSYAIDTVDDVNH